MSSWAKIILAHDILIIAYILIIAFLIGYAIIDTIKQVDTASNELCAVFNDTIVQLPDDLGEVNCTKWNAGQYVSY